MSRLRRLYFSLMAMLCPPPVPRRPSPPVIVVLGSTATGKSKLAIDLASTFGGEVISADSMQVYKGLDILTNKATKEEMKGIVHHLIGVVDRKEKFDVVHFRDQALPLVENILKAGKLPIIVGGTNYYIESLLWQVLIAEEGKKPPKKRKTEQDNEETELNSELLTNPIINLLQSNKGEIEDAYVSKFSNQEMYAALQLVDSERALRLHPNDRRKIIRSLQIRFQTGRRHSELIAEQCVPTDDRTLNESPTTVLKKSLGGPLRFTNSFCLWIQADKKLLDKRIEDRVEKMIELGLKQELNSYMDLLLEENSDLNYKEGILQSIGFKEFHSYLQLPPSDRETDEGEKLFREGVERLKIVTRQYARKQLKWVNQRFILPHRRQVPSVYSLDGNLVDETSWEENVFKPAKEIVNAYLDNNLELPLLNERRVVGNCDLDEDLEARVCEICENRVFIGIKQWKQHNDSYKHRRMLKKKGKNEIIIVPHENNNDIKPSEQQIVATT